MVKHASGRAVQAVLAILAVAKAVRACHWSMPGMPDTAIFILDMKVDNDLADVVNQCRIGYRGCPGLSLRSLILGCGSNWKQMRLPQFEGIGDDLKAVVEHAPVVCVVMAFRGGKLLDQCCVPFERGKVQGLELRARERRALPYVLKQLFSTRRVQQGCGRLRPNPPFGDL